MKKPRKNKAGGCLLLCIAIGAAVVIGVNALPSTGEDSAASVPGTSSPGDAAPTTSAPATPTPAESASAQPAPAGTHAVFQRTVDGDTITTDLGTIRIIGIDTPERGECGYEDAAGAVDRVLSPGDEVTLELPQGQRDTDRYGRLLRYVATPDGSDLGMLQIEAGLAAARYDSQDGYPKHPREAAYRAAAAATLGPDRTVQTTSCALVGASAHEGSGAAAGENSGAGAHAGTGAGAVSGSGSGADGDVWWTQYRSCSALKRNAVGHPKGPFNRDEPAEAAMYEWFAYGTGFNGDGDDDGLACE